MLTIHGCFFNAENALLFLVVFPFLFVLFFCKKWLTLHGLFLNAKKALLYMVLFCLVVFFGGGVETLDYTWSLFGTKNALQDMVFFYF